MNIAPTPEFQRAFEHVTGLECSPQNLVNTIRRIRTCSCRSGRSTPTLSGSPHNAGSSTDSRNDSRSTNQTSGKRRQSNERDSKARIATIAADGWDDTAAEAEARLIRGSLLKFADWKWSIGKEAIEVKEGRRLIAVATAAAWVKWQENKPVEYRLRETGGRLPDREELGDNDQAQWELGPDGKKCAIRGKARASCT